MQNQNNYKNALMQAANDAKKPNPTAAVPSSYLKNEANQNKDAMGKVPMRKRASEMQMKEAHIQQKRVEEAKKRG